MRRLSVRPHYCCGVFIWALPVCVAACETHAVEQPDTAATHLRSNVAAPATSVGATSSLDHSAHDCSLHAEPPKPAPSGASATALSRADVSRITSIRVSSHASSVLLRKQGQTWASMGKRGCSVSDARVANALGNLTTLRVEERYQVWPADAAFELQIDALVGEQHAIHFEVAQRRGDTDLVKLLNGGGPGLKGRDRQLWSRHPSAWCADRGNAVPSPSL